MPGSIHGSIGGGTTMLPGPSTTCQSCRSSGIHGVCQNSLTGCTRSSVYRWLTFAGHSTVTATIHWWSHSLASRCCTPLGRWKRPTIRWLLSVHTHWQMRQDCDIIRRRSHHAGNTTNRQEARGRFRTFYFSENLWEYLRCCVEFAFRTCLFYEILRESQRNKKCKMHLRSVEATMCETGSQATLVDYPPNFSTRPFSGLHTI